MNEPTLDSLDKMLSHLPTGQAPVDYLLRAGHAAKRRRRRASIAGAGAMTAVVLGGAYIAMMAVSPDGSGAPVANESQSTPVNLPTSGWKAGDPAHQALISGTLALDANGCVILDHPGYDNVTYATWPAGYTAETDADGRLVLRAPDGTVAAHGGDKISMSGGYGPAPTVPHPCLPQGEEIAYVQSEVSLDGSSS